MKIKAEQSVLVVVDIQERLLPAMHDPSVVIANAGLLLRAAVRLGVPVLASEQYPKGLGPTVPEVAALLPDGAVVPKIHFSCAGDEGFLKRFRALGRGQAVVCGIESHVCVLQTTLDLRTMGTDVFVVADAVSSRRPDSVRLAIDRLRGDGVGIVSAEMAVFEWLGQAGTPEFKDVSRWVK